ncbi:MAG: phosphate ABC transporter permease PstA [Spirochaetales bacterium]|nr:phosphate ABC transporter permease PstA [Spirochaetales bacterium]
MKLNLKYDRNLGLKLKDKIAKGILIAFTAVSILVLFWIIGYILYKGSYSKKNVSSNFFIEKNTILPLDNLSEGGGESAPGEALVFIVNKHVKVDGLDVAQLKEFFTSARNPKWGFITEQNLNASVYALFPQDNQLAVKASSLLCGGEAYGASVNFEKSDDAVINSVAKDNGGIGFVSASSLAAAEKNRKVKILEVYYRQLVATSKDKSPSSIAHSEILRGLDNLSAQGLRLADYREVESSNLAPIEIQRPVSKFLLTPAFLFTPPARSGQWGGISHIIVNTLLLVFFTILISCPIGMGAAIYLTQYAKERWYVKLIRLGVETLAGVPSIILGLFGHVFFVKTLGLGIGFASAILSITIMILPTIIRTMEEALKSVPESYKEGSYALGSTKLATIFKVVVPAASTGIITGVILAIGRVVSETAVLLYTLGSSYQLVSGPSSSARVLSQHIYLLFSEAISFEKAFASAAVLIIMILAINLIANSLIRRMNKMQID